MLKVIKKFLVLLLIVTLLIPSAPIEAKSVYRTVTKTVSKKECLGKFKITFYCPCWSCSGVFGGITSTGKRAKQGRTIAVDKHVIPYGSKVIIGKKTYIAEDCGGGIKGKRIDIFLNSHSKCLKNGVKYKKIYVLKKVKKKVKVKVN